MKFPEPEYLGGKLIFYMAMGDLFAKERSA